MAILKFWLSSESIRWETSPGCQYSVSAGPTGLNFLRGEDLDDLAEDLYPLYYGWAVDDARFAGYDDNAASAWAATDAAWEAAQGEAA